MMQQWVLDAQMFATLYMVGVIWFVQLAHYPLFAAMPPEALPGYQRANLPATTWAVGPPMLVELACAIALALWPPAACPGWAPWTGLALVAAIFVLTGAVFVPLHDRLLGGFDARTHRRLVRWSWARTILWTSRGVLVLACFRTA